MDINNNFENGFYGSEPQKPFTDKTNPQAPQFNQPVENLQKQPSAFTPEQPLMNNSSKSVENSENTTASNNNYNSPSIEPEPFNPVQHTAQYADHTFQNQQNITQPQQFNQPWQGGYSDVSYNDYSQPVYQNTGYNTQSAYNYYDNPQPSQQNYGIPNTNVPPQYPNPPYSPMYPQKPKSKVNAGLIAIIVVLCVLLVGSLIGIVVYISANDNDNRVNKNYSDNNIFDFTMPDYNYGDDYSKPDTQEETVPESYHEESDYSDKTNADYKGLTLNDKPKDASISKNYTAETAFSKVSDSVVGIVCYTDKVTSVENCDSQGSGIIITSDGYVVTNSHVINNSKTTYLIQIITSDGKEYSAGVVGYDSRTDIAVLKMDNAKNLRVATFGNSDKIELGEDIIAVGNPGGLDYQNSITKGIVSAVNRELSSTSLVKYIQTDAAINPGNSGGPIVNLYGQVIGIATSKIVSEQYEGMGFAIPSTTAKEIVDSLMRKGYVEGRVKIGISGTAVDSETASSMNVPQGILVAEVSSDGPCADSPLQTDDIITEIDGKTVASFADVYEILEQHKAGDKVEIKYYRYSNDSEGEFEITLQEDK